MDLDRAIRGVVFGHDPCCRARNARLVARSRGLNVVERKTERAEDTNYANLITLTVRTNGDRRVVAGTLFQEEPRLVRIDDFWVDVAPVGHVLVTRHLDRPGIIGAVGNNGKINQKEFESIFGNAKRRIQGNKNDREIKKMIVQVMEDSGLNRVKTGWFSNWYATLKSDLGMS